MFTTVKVREGLGRNDYKDPDPYQHPKGSLAKEVVNDLPPVSRSEINDSKSSVEMTVRKPMGDMEH